MISLIILNVDVPRSLLQLTDINNEFARCQAPKGFLLNLQNHFVRFHSYYLHFAGIKTEFLKVETVLLGSH